MRKRIRRKTSSGFTLIELMVVIAIIAFLASIILASLNSSKQKAYDAQITSDMSQMRNALELYSGEHGNSYPKISEMAKAQSSSTTSAIADFAGSLVKIPESSAGSVIHIILGFFSEKVFAQQIHTNLNCKYYDELDAYLVPHYIARLPLHPLDDGGDVCYKYFSSTDGNVATVYGSLVTQKYADGSNKQIGIVVGKTDLDSLKAICRDNNVSGVKFPLFAGNNSSTRCDSPSVADTVLGVTGGEGDVQISYSCSLSQYSNRLDCETDHSYCDDSQYRNESDCVANGSTAAGSCSDSSGTYTDEVSCTGSNPGQGAGSYFGGYCVDQYGNQQGYYDQSSCVAAGYDMDSGYCSGGGYSDSGSCTSNGSWQDYYYCDNNGSITDSQQCYDGGGNWYYGGQQYTPYGWTSTGTQHYSYGYSWNQGTWQPYGYTWNPGQYTQNVWHSAPAGTWSAS
jgi:prepilin-type N-terminal cleavage/methylation domain-containing protein